MKSYGFWGPFPHLYKAFCLVSGEWMPKTHLSKSKTEPSLSILNHHKLKYKYLKNMEIVAFEYKTLRPPLMHFLVLWEYCSSAAEIDWNSCGQTWLFGEPKTYSKLQSLYTLKMLKILFGHKQIKDIEVPFPVWQ